jgi:hypothetical protein
MGLPKAYGLLIHLGKLIFEEPGSQCGTLLPPGGRVVCISTRPWILATHRHWLTWYCPRAVSWMAPTTLEKVAQLPGPLVSFFLSFSSPLLSPPLPHSNQKHRQGEGALPLTPKGNPQAHSSARWHLYKEQKPVHAHTAG